MPKSLFISWSGNRAQRVATIIKQLVEGVLPNPHVFLSSRDIPGGRPWFSEISRAIENSNAGLVILTKENVGQPWILFESGAIAKHVDQAHLIPIMCDISPGDLAGSPLAQFQALNLSQDDVARLCEVLAAALELDMPDIPRRVNVWWKALEEDLATAMQMHAGDPIVPHEPSISDLATQLEQVKVALNALAAAVQHGSIAAGIQGQGPLATATIAQAANLVAPFLPSAQSLSQFGGSPASAAASFPSSGAATASAASQSRPMVDYSGSATAQVGPKITLGDPVR